MGIGFGEGLLIAAILMLLFGGKKIPELGRTLGASIRGFKEGMKGEDKEASLHEKDRKDDKKPS